MWQVSVVCWGMRPYCVLCVRQQPTVSVPVCQEKLSPPLQPDGDLVPTKACPTLTPSAVPHRPLQSPHRSPEL